MRRGLLIPAAVMAVGVSIGLAVFAHAEEKKAPENTSWWEGVKERADAKMEERERSRPPPPPPRFEVVSDGVLDNQEKVMWRAADSGRKMSWDEARAYCSTRGPGWELPGRRQLESLRDRRSGYRKNISYGTGQWAEIYPVTDLIHFSGWVYWSKRREGPQAWAVAFYEFWLRRRFPLKRLFHVLCVRSL